MSKVTGPGPLSGGSSSSLIMSQAELVSREKSGIFSFCCAKAEPSPAAARASTTPTARLIRSSAGRLVGFAELASDMVDSSAQSGGSMIERSDCRLVGVLMSTSPPARSARGER